MSNQDRYDSAFLGILQNEGQIQEFLDVFFSFLYRRTDFFRHLITPTDKYGFRPGVAKKLVLNAFKKYESLAAEKNRKLKEAYEKFLEEEKTRMDAEACHVVAREEIVAEAPTRPEFEMTVETTTETTSSEGAQETYDTVRCDNVMESSDKDEGTKHVSLETSRDVPVPNSDDAVENNRLLEAPQATDSIPLPVDTASDRHSRGGDGAVCDDALVKVQSSTAKDVNEKKKSGGSDDDDDDSELARAQRLYQANPESYNGAIRENYSWSQSITDLDVRVKVPGFVKSSKKMGVSVKVDRKHLRVTYKDLMGSEVVVVDGDLCWDVHRDESTWSLVPGEQVHINMEKVQERWWDALLEGEPKISTRKIDPSRPITDLGDEEQAKIAEMMYNERQKRLGLPQSHEMKTHELLKKAWDAEGSPFKGQPFDPAKLNISTGGF